MTRPWTALSIALCATLLLGWRLPRLRMDNTPAVWLPSDSAGLRDLKRFEALFGDDLILLAYVEGDKLAEHAGAWKGLAGELQSVPGIASVFAPPFVESDSEAPPAPLRFYLVSQDGRYAAIAMLPKSGLPDAERARLVDRLETVLARWETRIGRGRHHARS
jgi:hypothetical protein